MSVEKIEQPPSLPARDVSGHKGTFGRVLIVGGHEQMIGAPVLAGTSALKMGAGLVQIAVPQSILPAAISITPELIGLALSKNSNRNLIEAAEKADAIVVGPGLGQSPVAWTRVKQLLQIEKPMVIDADALNLLSKQKKWPAKVKARAVLTPHPGEMQRLLTLIGQEHVPHTDEGRSAIAIEAALDFKQVIVLKGHRTVVTDGHRVYINQTGDSSLSKAGTGDVLSGMIGCLLAQEMEPTSAAILGVYLHGRAGEIAGRKLGQRSVLARDVIDSIPMAIGMHEQSQ
jgi:hydroxyethylthiazole kinase-like uncharacterized protein yjeF